MSTRIHALLTFAVFTVIAGCSDATGVGSSLTIAPLYHLRSIDGTSVPFTSADGEVTDSGRVLRLGGDTVRVDLITRSGSANGLPEVIAISFGTWRATQSGNVVALFPLLASTFDTATVAGDTLTLRAHDGTTVHIDVYVAP